MRPATTAPMPLETALPRLQQIVQTHHRATRLFGQPVVLTRRQIAKEIATRVSGLEADLHALTHRAGPEVRECVAHQACGPNGLLAQLRQDLHVANELDHLPVRLLPALPGDPASAWRAA